MSVLFHRMHLGVVDKYHKHPTDDHAYGKWLEKYVLTDLEVVPGEVIDIDENE